MIYKSKLKWTLEKLTGSAESLSYGWSPIEKVIFQIEGVITTQPSNALICQSEEGFFVYFFLISRLCNYCFGIQEFQQSARCCQEIFSCKVLSTLQENQHPVAGSGSIPYHLCCAVLPPHLSSLFVKIRIKVLSSKGDLKATAE